jgi:hypothetical protein
VKVAEGTGQMLPLTDESVSLPPTQEFAEPHAPWAFSPGQDETRPIAAAATSALAVVRHGGRVALGQKLSHAGLALSFGAVGEAIGQILGSFISVSPNGLGHACGAVFAGICSIFLFFTKPVTLRGKLTYYARLHSQGLITKTEYQELRRRCLSGHRD